MNLLKPSVQSGGLIHKQITNVLQNFSRGRRVGSPGQSQGKPRAEKYFGLKAIAGSYCNEREVLVTQRYLKYHPGLNTAIDPRDNAIYSICEGTILVSTEKFDPNMKNEYVQKYYEQQQSQNIYKRYVHVIPTKQPQQFKLVDLI